ncbi:MAG: hypothetical protein JWO48_372 [Bryobacterales bacterium]|nr:hypothetical protein [Bryobacterales bacterium]
MLISSSFVSTAAWHTDQINKVTDLATQVSSGATRSQSRPAARQESAGNAAHPIAPGKTQVDHKSEIKDKRATPRAESRAESHTNRSRRAHRKTLGTAEQSGNESPKPASTMPPATDVEPPPFLAILNDVLPQDIQSSPNHADQTSDGKLASSSQAPSNPRAPSAADAPNTNTQVEGLALQEKLAAAKTNSQSAEKMSTAESTAAASKGELTVPRDSSLEITKEITSPGTKPALNEKPAERGEMAFAVRVSERTTLTAALNLNDVQAAIAASRFDAAGAGSHSNTREHAEPRAALPIQKGAQTSSAADATAEQSGLPNDLTSGEPSARQPAGPQDLLARSAGTPGNARATSTTGPAIAAATSPSAGGAQQPAAGMNAPGTLPATTPESRNPSTVKSASEGHSPQFLDSQDENASRAPGSVRDISLKLTSKDQAPVQVRLSERAGELHVSVRTPDAGLTRGLRDGLSDLVGHLEHNGYRTESWQPNGNRSSSPHDQAQDSPSHNNSSQQQNAGGSGNGSRQQQNARDHQEPETQTPKWVGELESSLQRSLRSWPPSATR